MPDSSTNAATWLLLLAVLGVALGATLVNGFPRTGVAPSFELISTGYEAGVQGPPVAFNLSGYHGRPVVLDLMAVSCTSCRELTRQVLQPLAAAHPGLALVSIDIWSDPSFGVTGETDAELVALQHAEPAPWRHARDTDHVALRYGVTSLPRLVIVASDGQVAYAHTGIPSLATVERAVADAQAPSLVAAPVALRQAGAVGLAVLAGGMSVISPCSIGLLPAYLGVLLGQGDPAASAGDAAPRVGGAPQTTALTARAAEARRRARLGRALRTGLATAAGILAFYLLLTAGLAILALGGKAAWLRLRLPGFSALVGGLLVALGIATMAAVDWRRMWPARRIASLGAAQGHQGVEGTSAANAAGVTSPADQAGPTMAMNPSTMADAETGKSATAPGKPKAAPARSSRRWREGRGRLFAFGVTYGAAAFGCSGPAVMPIVLVAFQQGAVTGLLASGAYAATVTVLAVGAAVLVATSRGAVVAALGRHARRLQLLSGAMLAGSGLYLLWFAARGA